MEITLDPHQVRDVEGLYHALKSNGSALDGGDTGIGKSVTFLGLCKKVGARPCIVTRMAVVPAWLDLCKKMGVTPLFVTNYESLLTDGFRYCVKEVKVTGNPKNILSELVSIDGGVTWTGTLVTGTTYKDPRKALFVTRPFATVSTTPVPDEKNTFAVSITLDTESLNFSAAEVSVARIPPRTTREFKDWNLPDNRVIFAFDEAQSLRNPGSFISKAAVGASKKYKVCLLSATPFQTSLEAQAIGVILKLFTEHGTYPWLLKHGCKKGIFGPLEFIGDVKDKKTEEPGTNRVKGALIMEKINSYIFPLRGVRTRRDQVPGFPESVIRAELIETGGSSEIQEMYLKELEESRNQDLKDACRGVDPEFHHLVEVLGVTVNLRLRQEIELLKVGAIAELAKDAAATGERVAIFVNFDATIECLKRLLDTNLVIRGTRSKTDLLREHAVQAFVSNNHPYILVNLAAGGAGLSLHDPVGKTPRTSLIMPPFTAIQLRQVQGRVWRRGGGFSTQRILFAAGTIEEKMKVTLEGLNTNLDCLLDSHLDIKNYIETK